MNVISYGNAKLGELSAGLPKVARRFVAEMIFGIPGLPALCSGRWNPPVSLQPNEGIEEVPGAAECRPRPTVALRFINFLGEVHFYNLVD
jgi:hypothetical protein